MINCDAATANMHNLMEASMAISANGKYNWSKILEYYFIFPVNSLIRSYATLKFERTFDVAFHPIYFYKLVAKFAFSF